MTKNRDATADAHMLEIVERAAQAWRRTFDSMDFVVLTADAGGIVQRVNRFALSLLGGRFEDWLYRPSSELPDVLPWSEVKKLVDNARADGMPHRSQAGTEQVWDLSCTGFGPGDEFCVVWARDITETVELHRAVVRSQAMSAMGQLLAGVAHEVRNPLFAITALLDAWALQPGVQETPFLPMLRKEVTRMRQLMEELLEYGRPYNPELVAGDLREVAAEAMSILKAAADERNLTFQIDVNGVVRMDRVRMLRVFLNLLQNAIDHSPPGGVVRLESRLQTDVQPTTLEIAIRDYGPGFTGEDLPRVFDPFFTKRQGGTGLGLPIVQRIVEEHGGTITAGNHEAGGAVLRLRFPTAEAPAPASD